MAKVTARLALDELNFRPEAEGTAARERQVQQLLYVFNGFSSHELAQFSAGLIRELDGSKKSETEKQNIICNFEAMTNYVREEELMEKENKSKPEVDRSASLTNTQRLNVERQRNMQISSGGRLVSDESRITNAFKYAVAKIQDVVTQAKESIELKVAEIKNNIEERKSTAPQQKTSFLDRIKNAAQKAKDKITALGDKAVETIAKLSSKNQSKDIEMQEISSPKNFKHVEKGTAVNNEAVLKANATLNTSHGDTDADNVSLIDEIHEEIAKVDANIEKTVGEFKGTAEKLLQEQGLEMEADFDQLDAAIKAMDEATPGEKAVQSNGPTKDPGSTPSTPRGPG